MNSGEMMVLPHKNVHLTDRDEKILRFVAKHRGVWFDVLHNKFFSGLSVDAVKSTLRRLRGTHSEPLFLKSIRLPDGHVYYQLTYRGTRHLGRSHALARPLSLQSCASQYATQWFLYLDGNESRMLVDRKKIGIESPGTSTIQTPFYIEGDSVFGFILLDCANDKRRLSQKLLVKLDSFLRTGWFDEYISAKAFVATVLTISETKKRDFDGLPRYLRFHLRERLRGFRIGFGKDQHITLKLVVVPGLSNLLPSKGEPS